MSDLISRQAAIEETWKEPSYTDPLNVLAELRDRIKDLPSAQPERKKGKWTVGADMQPMMHRNGKPKKFWPSFRYCSVCGHEAFDDSDWGEQLFDWCPYCGADMRRKR